MKDVKLCSFLRSLPNFLSLNQSSKLGFVLFHSEEACKQAAIFASTLCSLATRTLNLFLFSYSLVSSLFLFRKYMPLPFANFLHFHSALIVDLASGPSSTRNRTSGKSFRYPNETITVRLQARGFWGGFYAANAPPCRSFLYLIFRCP